MGPCGCTACTQEAVQALQRRQTSPCCTTVLTVVQARHLLQQVVRGQPSVALRRTRRHQAPAAAGRGRGRRGGGAAAAGDTARTHTTPTLFIREVLQTRASRGQRAARRWSNLSDMRSFVPAGAAGAGCGAAAQGAQHAQRRARGPVLLAARR